MERGAAVASNGAIIKEIIEESLAAETGIEKGDRLVAINGIEINDFIDYRYMIADEYLEVDIIKANDEEWVIEIEKDYDEDLGIVFDDNAFGNIRQCSNHCIFCFVDQMPLGMRDTLYVKDDDYRHSFLQGNFITLTNLSEKEIQRIIKMHLSPLFISVHTTNPELRVQMQGNKNAGRVMDIMRAFSNAGLEMHTQVVLCPGINDGPELKRTIEDISSLRPQVSSMAVVPVGITRHREGLYKLRTYTYEEANDVIKIVKSYQDKFIKENDSHFVYAADEFYLMGDVTFPSTEIYDDFSQTENGVGLARLFLDSFNLEAKNLPEELTQKRKLTLATGVSGAKVLNQVVDRLNKIKNLEVGIQVIRNYYFGETVTVSGLVTGGDLVNQLSGKEIGDALLIPSVMLKRDDSIFLDDIKVNELSQRLGVKILIVALDLGAKDFIKKVTGGDNNG